jgi:hypothetical protein
MPPRGLESDCAWLIAIRQYFPLASSRPSQYPHCTKISFLYRLNGIPLLSLKHLAENRSFL